MLAGRPPFQSGSQANVFRMIKEDPVKFSSRVKASEEASGLVEALLAKVLLVLILSIILQNPAKRLGTLGAPEVKEHKFFRSVSWHQMEQVCREL
jgi:hypothetical protein